MLAELIQDHRPLDKPEAFRHLLVVLPKSGKLSESFPGAEALKAALSRRGGKPQELADTPVATAFPTGCLVVFVMVDFSKSVFEQHTAVRKALQLLLEEKPGEIAISVHGTVEERRGAAQRAVYAAWVNGVALPERKTKRGRKPLGKIHLFGFAAPGGFPVLRSCAEGNVLARKLTMLPPNESVEKRFSRSDATAANSELRIFLEGRGAMMCEDACGSGFSFSIA